MFLWLNVLFVLHQFHSNCGESWTRWTKLFSLRYFPNIPNLTKKWTRKAVIFGFNYFEVPSEKLHVTHYKSFSHTIIWPERLQLFLLRSIFCKEAFSPSHHAGTCCLVAICLLPNGAPCCLWDISQGNIFPWSDTHNPTCQAAAGNWAGNASQCCPKHALYRLGRKIFLKIERCERVISFIRKLKRIK